MNCKEISDALKKAKSKVEERNASTAAYDLGLKKMSPEDVKSILINQYGHSPEAADAIVGNAHGHGPDDVETASVAEHIASKAMATAAEIDPKDPASKQTFIKNGWAAARGKILDLAAKGLNVIPDGINQPLRKLMEKFASQNTFIKIGDTDTYAGLGKGKQIGAEVDQLYKEYKKSNPSGLDRQSFEVGLHALAMMRGKDPESYINQTRVKAEEILKSGNAPASIKPLLSALDRAEAVNAMPKAHEYLDGYFKDLDNAGGHMAEKGVLRDSVDKDGKILPATRKDYMYNIVQVAHFQDGFDRKMYGDKLTTSNIQLSKKYENGIEGMLNGVTPASLTFSEVASSYWKAVGSALRKVDLAENIRNEARATMKGNRSMQIEISSDQAEPAFLLRDASKPNWSAPTSDKNGKPYMELSNVAGPRFANIYAHPDIYRWYSKTFQAPEVNGAATAFLRANNFIKGTILAGSFFHAVSLGKKAAYIMETNGIGHSWEMRSVNGEGLSAMMKDSKDFPTLLKLVENGFGIHSHDMFTNPILQGRERGIAGTIGDSIKQYTNWVHGATFDKWQLGTKVGLALRLLKNEDWVNKVVKEHGGDQDAPFRAASQILNDTMGAQNLEFIGRSRMAQTVMQAALLAPDWTESKIKRLAGAVGLSDDPTVRRTMKYAILAQLAAVIATKVVAQQVIAATGGPNQSFEDMAKDFMERKGGTLLMGHTPGKKGERKEIRLVPFGSENQDLALLAAPFQGLYQAYQTGQPGEVARPLVQELAHKAGPGLKFFLDKSEKKRQQSGNLSTGITQAAMSGMPIGAQQAIQAAQGDFGTSGLGTAAATAGVGISSMAGVPTQLYNERKPEPKTHRAKKGAKTGDKIKYFK